MDKSRPIIVIKKKVSHGGHHGGAWKVAYADFVTAMMSLFIVLWLMNSSVKVQEAVAGYFRDPKGDGKMAGTAKAGAASQEGAVLSIKKDDMKHLEAEIQKALKALPEFQKIKDQVEMSITSEGLRIELMETEKGTFFESGNSKPTAAGTELLRSLATELGKLPNRVLIEGHTDARPYIGSGTYSNWELSTDRANQARVVMQATGLKPAQVQQVRGFADQSLRDAAHPADPANRRISVLVPFMERQGGEKDEKKEGEKGKPEHEGKPEGKAAEHGAKPAEPEKKESPAGHEKK